MNRPIINNAIPRAGTVLALALAIVAAIAAPAQAVSTTVVISEVQLRCTNNLSDEFVEIYNLSNAPATIGGLRLAGSNSAGINSSRATIPAGTTLAPGCHYLMANGGYDGPTAADQFYNTAIVDDGGAALRRPDNSIVDQVGWNNGSAFKEGTVLTPLTTNVDRSYERRPGGAAGGEQDTDDNAADFVLRNPSAPQNLASACVPQDPIAVGDSATVAEDAPATAIDALANDTDSDGGPLAIASVDDSTADGTVAITGGGSGLSYEPDPDYCSEPGPPDSFPYTLNGGSTAIVSVTVTCVDDDPIAVGDSATAAEDAPATAIDALANDTDSDGGPLAIA